MIGSEYISQIKVEATEGDPATDFSSGATVLEHINQGLNVSPRKRLTAPNSNFNAPYDRQIPTGRDNEGSLNVLMHQDDRQVLMDLLFDRTMSWGLQLAKGSTAGQQLFGVKANTGTINAQQGGLVELNYDLVALSEKKISAPTIDLPTTRLTPYRYATGLAVINGAAADDITGFSLTKNNNLLRGPHRHSSLQISYLEYGRAELTGQATVRYKTEAYNDLVRGTTTGTFWFLLGDSLAVYTSGAWDTPDYFTTGATAIKLAGSTPTVVTLTGGSGSAVTNAGANGNALIQDPVFIKINAAEFPEAPENAGNDGVVTQTINFTVTAPASGSVNPVDVFIDAIS